MSVGTPHYDEELQRASGAARVVVDGSDGVTRVMDVFQQYPLRIMFPRASRGDVNEAVLVNASGGVAGGDHLELSVVAKHSASISVTSQAAEKVYRALSKPARVVTKLELRAGARIAWLPQETIVFDRARLTRGTHIDLDGTTELLAVEWLVLGRTAHGEQLAGGYIDDGWRVRIDGRLAWADNFRVTDPIFPQLGRNALLAGCKALATLVCFGPHPRRRLEFFRDRAPSLECPFAVTSVSGLVVARLAAPGSWALRVALGRLLHDFNRAFGPGPFGVPKMWSC